MAYGIAFAIADPCRIRDCLPVLALHVNVYALITPPPWRAFVPTAIAKESARGHPSGQFFNLLLAPRVCSPLASSHAKEG